MPAAAWSRALAVLIMEFLIHSLSFHPWKELLEIVRRKNCVGKLLLPNSCFPCWLQVILHDQDTRNTPQVDISLFSLP